MAAPVDACPTAARLAAFARGELDPASSAPVARHVEGCPRCRKRAAEVAPTGVVRGAAHGLPPELVESGEYENVVELGRGGMGVVYKARNTLMGRVEVLKVMGREVMARPGAADRFRREIQAAARLNHPNVVTAYSARVVGGRLVFSMEYVPGDDFARLVKERGALPVAHAAHYGRQVADGLQHAHEQGMVHRDIKPANLILSRDGKRPVVKILDFGLARVASADDDAPRLTAAGGMLGTPHYVAPEQARDAQAADTRSDVYSLGCTLYFFLTGRPPFEADSVVGVLIQHRSATAEYLHTVRPDVPVELAAVVARMMEKDPARRYQTPAAVSQALATFARAGGNRPAPQPAEPTPGPASVELVAVPAPTWTPHAPPPPPPSGVTVVHAQDSAWESVPSASRSADDPAGRRAAARRRSRRGYLLPVGVLVASLGLAVGGVWVAGLADHDRGGQIVIDDLPRDAVVELDGKKVAAAWKGEDGVVEVPRRGRHRVRVVRGKQELYSDIVAVGDEPGRVTLRAAPASPSTVPVPTRPTAKSSPQPAPAGERVRWAHDKGWFRSLGSGEWEELAPNGLVHRFRETAQTTEYLELQHSELATRVRLYPDRCELSVGGREYRAIYTGAWVAGTPGTAPPATAAQATDRLRWVHTDGEYRSVGSGVWEERSKDGAVKLLNESARTPEYVELQERIAVFNLVRLYVDRYERKAANETVYRTGARGRWADAVPPSPSPGPPTAPVSKAPPPQPPPPPPPQVVNISSGTWRVVNNELIGVADSTKKGLPVIEFGRDDWTDVTFEFEAKAVGGKPNFFAKARSANEVTNGALSTNHVMASFGAGGASLLSWRKNASLGSVTRAWRDNAKPAPDQGWRLVPENQWFSVSLATTAQRADLKIDNRAWVLLTFSRPETWSGKVGLTVMSGTTAFRNIRVTSPSGAVLWNRLPDPP